MIRQRVRRIPRIPEGQHHGGDDEDALGLGEDRSRDQTAGERRPARRRRHQRPDRRKHEQRIEIAAEARIDNRGRIQPVDDDRPAGGVVAGAAA